MAPAAIRRVKHTMTDQIAADRASPPHDPDPHAPARSRTITCILNASAGTHQAEQVRDTLAALFARHGAAANIVLTRGGAGLVEAARRAVAEGGDQPIVAGGGDGTLNAVAGVLAGTGRVFGVLPLGTLNHFAKDLGIPLELEAAVATLFHGTVARVDVGEVNGQIFLNNSSLGIYPALVREREALQRGGASKWVAFARALVSISWRYKPLTVGLTVDAREEPGDETPFVFIGNNRYETMGSHLGERARLDSGHLWICRAPRAGRGKLLGMALRALLGRPAPGALETHEARDCWIRTRTRHPRVARDGEVAAMISPLHYRSRPGALNVLVPATGARLP